MKKLSVGLLITILLAMMAWLIHEWNQSPALGSRGHSRSTAVRTNADNEKAVEGQVVPIERASKPEQANQNPAQPEPAADNKPTPPPAVTGLTGRVATSDGNPIPGAAVLFVATTRRNPQDHESARQSARQRDNPTRDLQQGMNDLLGRGSQGTLFARADDHGRFTLATPTPDTLHGILAASAPDFQPASIDLDQGPKSPVEITLAPRGGLLFVITDEDGKPVPQIQLHIWTTESRVDRIPPGHQPGMDYAQTDAAGKARHDTKGGRLYHVRTFSQRHVPGEEVNIAPIAGQTVTVALTLKRGLILTGKAVDQDGRGVPGAWLQSTYTDAQVGRHVVAARADLDGVFILSGFESRHLPLPIWVYAQGYAPGEHTLESVSTSVTLVVKRLGVISGRLERPDGSPVLRSDQPRVFATQHSDRDADEDDLGGIDNPGFGYRAQQTLEWYWVDASGQALDPTGKPDPRYEQPGSGTMALQNHLQEVMGRATVTSDPEAEGKLDAPPTPGAQLHYRIVGLMGGEYTVTAMAPNFAPAKPATVKLPAHGWARNVNLRLLTGCTLRGLVTGPDGKPIAGATVHVSDRLVPRVENLSQLDPADAVAKLSSDTTPATWERTAATNAEGEYSFSALPGGATVVGVAVKKLAMTMAVVELPPVGEVRHDVQLVAGLTITGRIRLADGGTPPTPPTLAVYYGYHKEYDQAAYNPANAQADHAYAQAIQAERQLISNATDIQISAAGDFTISGLSPGRYTLIAKGVGGTPATTFAQAGDANVGITLGAVGSITGMIVQANGTPPTSGTITVVSSDRSHWGSFALSDGKPDGRAIRQRRYQQGGNWSFSYDAKTGGFTISNVPPGTYGATVVVEDCAVATVEGIVVTAGRATSITVRLESPYTLDLVVRDADGRGHMGATVTAYPRPGAVYAYANHMGRHEQIAGTTDSAGNVRLDRIPWPVVTVQATGANSGNSVTVVVDLRTEQQIEIRLGRTGQITGVVRDAQGKPMARIAVHGYVTDQNPNGTQTPRQTQTNDAGEFRFEAVAPGQWWISVPALQQWRNGHDTASAHRMVVVKEGQTAHVEFGGPTKTAAQVTVTGRVSRGGKPTTGQITFYRPGAVMTQKTVMLETGGTYRTDLEPGDYLVMLPPRNDRRVRVTVPSGQPAAVIDLEVPECRLVGTVTDSRGVAISGITVEARMPHKSTSDLVSRVEMAMPVGMTLTQSNGRYELGGLAPGTYEVWVRQRMLAMPGSGGDSATVPHGLPITFAGLVTLRTADDVTRDVQLSAAGTVRLVLEGFAREAFSRSAVNVLDSEGRRVPLNDDWYNRVTLTGASSMLPNLMPGEYAIHLHVPGSARVIERVMVRPGVVSEVRLTAVAGSTLTVNFSGTPPSAEVSRSWRLLDGVGRDLTPYMDLMAAMAGGNSDSFGPGRPLVLEDLAPGRYRVEIRVGAESYQAEAEVRGAPAAITIPLR